MLRREGRLRLDAAAVRVEEALAVAHEPLLDDRRLDGRADAVAEHGGEGEARHGEHEEGHDDEADEVVVVAADRLLARHVLRPLVGEEEDERDDDEDDGAREVEDPLLVALLREQRADPVNRFFLTKFTTFLTENYKNTSKTSDNTPKIDDKYDNSFYTKTT